MAVLAHELPGNLDRKLLAFLYKSIHELITTTLEDARGGQGVLCNCATVNTGDTGGVFAGFKHVKQAVVQPKGEEGAICDFGRRKRLSALRRHMS